MMWALLSRYTQLTIILAIGVLGIKTAEAATLWLGLDRPSFWQSISATVFVIGTLLLLIFNLIWRRIWKRLSFLSRIVCPDLNGIWEGTLDSTWINPQTNQPLPPIPTTITIEQTLLSLHIALQTGESKSNSGRAFLERMAMRGCYRVWYDYSNGPRAKFHDRSKPHEGVAFLEIDMNAAPDVLEGSYYTARKTTGDISVKRKADMA